VVGERLAEQLLKQDAQGDTIALRYSRQTFCQLGRDPGVQAVGGAVTRGVPTPGRCGHAAQSGAGRTSAVGDTPEVISSAGDGGAEAASGR
jgi:hypothetical protein